MHPSQSQPAIILITADQLRKDALGCYGAQAVQTPHLDRLAARGAQFQRAYTVSPWCLPSRCALLTGQFPHTHGAYSNFRNRSLSPDVPNLYTLLKAGGYRTGHIGKCHYAPVAYNQTRPDQTLPYDEMRAYYLSLGMDDLILQDDKQVSVWYYDDYAKDLEEAGYLEAYRAAIWNRELRKVFPFPGSAEWHPDSWVGRKAAEYIRRHDASKPLFCWVSFSGPHFPFDAPREYFERVDASRVGQGIYREGEWDDPRRIHHDSFHGPRANGLESGVTGGFSDDYWFALRRNYFANVALLDDQIGAILSAARERFGDNALVLFTADHGEMLGNHRLWGKGNCGYEDVLNVPLLAGGPGFELGARSDAKVMLTDVLPMCLNIAGVAPPHGSDGEDLREVSARGGHRHTFSEGEGFATVSDGRCKLVRLNKNGRDYAEMFDLERDPGEFENVAGWPEYAARRAGLQAALLDLWMGALLP